MSNTPATTTVEEDLHSASQRKINLIWEYTQAAIAVLVVAANIAVVFVVTESELLAYAFFLVIGFYFGRTNHSRVGGVRLDTR